MKRRDFFRTTLPAAVLPGIINGFSLKSFAADSPLSQLLGGGTDTDHVLVIVQLQGGNDGLNMVIPRDQYSKYFNARSNVAIAENRILPLNGKDKTGLHPSMDGLQKMYNEETLAIVQSV